LTIPQQSVICIIEQFTGVMSMRKFSGSFLIVLLGIGLVLGLGGCAQGVSTTVPTAANPVQAYADPATTVTLQGLSENDLAKYTQYCDAAIKGAVTVDIL